VNLLLDTHILIWTLSDDPRLSEHARAMISSPNSVIFYSTASLWEIAIKNMKSPEKCPYHEKAIRTFCDQAGFLSFDIRTDHVLAIRTLQIRPDRYLSNQDPFDRILLGQAKVENCRLLSHDTAFLNYGEPCIMMV